MDEDKTLISPVTKQIISTIAGESFLSPVILTGGRYCLRSLSSPVAPRRQWQQKSQPLPQNKNEYNQTSLTKEQKPPSPNPPELLERQKESVLSELEVSFPGRSSSSDIQIDENWVEEVVQEEEEESPHPARDSFDWWRCFIEPERCQNLELTDSYCSLFLTLDRMDIADCTIVNGDVGTENVTTIHDTGNISVGDTIVRQSLLPYVRVDVNGVPMYRSRAVVFEGGHEELIWDESFACDIFHPYSTVSIQLFDKDYGKDEINWEDEFLGSVNLPLHLLWPNKPHEMTVDFRCRLPNSVPLATLVKSELEAVEGSDDVNPPVNCLLRLKVEFEMKLRSAPLPALAEVAALSLQPPPYSPQEHHRTTSLDLETLAHSVLVAKEIVWDKWVFEAERRINEIRRGHKPLQLTLLTLYVLLIWLFPFRSFCFTLIILGLKGVASPRPLKKEPIQLDLITDNSTFLTGVVDKEPKDELNIQRNKQKTESEPTESELIKSLLNSALSDEIIQKLINLQTASGSWLKWLKNVDAGCGTTCILPGSALSFGLICFGIMGVLFSNTVIILSRILLFVLGVCWLLFRLKYVGSPMRMVWAGCHYCSLCSYRSQPSVIVSFVKNSCKVKQPPI